VLVDGSTNSGFRYDGVVSFSVTITLFEQQAANETYLEPEIRFVHILYHSRHIRRFICCGKMAANADNVCNESCKDSAKADELDDEGKVKDMAEWMGRLPDHLLDIPLHKLPIPGVCRSCG
jgi:hypothetical protein